MRLIFAMYRFAAALPFTSRPFFFVVLRRLGAARRVTAFRLRVVVLAATLRRRFRVGAARFVVGLPRENNNCVAWVC
jgi:hypothetical protein